MDEKQLQVLWDSYGSSAGFKDIKEFKDLMSDEGARKIFFESSNKKLGFKDFNEFEDLLGVKKKEQSTETSPVFDRPLGQGFDSKDTKQPQSIFGSDLPSESTSSDSNGDVLPPPPSIYKQDEQLPASSTVVEPKANFALKQENAALPVAKVITNTPEGVREEAVVQPELPLAVKQNIDAVTPDLISKDRNELVSDLNYRFGDMHFRFTTSGTGIAAYSPTGDRIDIKTSGAAAGVEDEEAKKLHDFIQSYAPSVKKLNEIDEKYQAENKKFSSQAEVDAAMKPLSEEANDLNKSIKEYIKQKAYVQAEANKLQMVPLDQRNTPEYAAKHASLVQWTNDLTKSEAVIALAQSDLVDKRDNLTKAVGAYVDSKSGNGSYVGYLWNKALSGVGKIESGLYGAAVDLAVGITPSSMILDDKALMSSAKKYAQENNIAGPKEGQSDEDWYKSIPDSDKYDIVSYATDQMKKYAKEHGVPGTAIDKGQDEIRNYLKDTFGDSSVSLGYEQLKDKGTLTGLVGGLAEMLPAMTTPGGWAARTASFFSQVKDGVDQEMNENPEFKNVSENEKNMVSIPIGIISTVLLEAGMKGIVNSQPALNKFAGDVIKSTMERFGSNATEVQLKSMAQEEAKKIAGNQAYNIVTSGVMGAGVKAGEYGIKDIYNYVKDNEMFKTPEVMSREWVKDVIMSGAQFAMGAAILDAPRVMSEAYDAQKFTKVDDAVFKMFEEASNDPKIKQAFVLDLKNKINSGEISPIEAASQLDGYNQSLGIYRSIPDGLDMAGKKEAMTLLREKRAIETEIAGKDPALTKAKRERITEIDMQLEALSSPKETPQNEQSISEPSTEAPQSTEAGGAEIHNESTQTGDTKTEGVTENQPAEENTFESKARGLADKIRSAELPDWAKATLPDGTKVQGISHEIIKNMIADAVVEIGKLMDKGVEFSKALTEASKKLVEHFGEDKRDKIEQDITDRFNKGEKLSEKTLPGYDRMKTQVDGIVERAIESGADKERAMTGVEEYVKKSKAYENATDTQREQFIREVRKMFGKKEIPAPKVGDVLKPASKLFGGIGDELNMTVSDKELVAIRLREQEIGADAAKKATKDASIKLSEEIADMVKKGKLTARQAAMVLKKFSKTNVLSESSVKKFVDHMDKIFKNADYADRVASGNALRKSVRKLSNNKDKQVNLRTLGRAFAEIEPSMVGNIKLYNKMAEQIKQALAGSKVVKEDLKVAEMVNVEEAQKYIDETLEKQKQTIADDMAAEIKDVMGIDANGLTYEQMKELVNSEDGTDKYDETVIRNSIKTAFKSYADVVDHILKTGEDPITGDPISTSKENRNTVFDFMNMDTDKLRQKDALGAIDALANFIKNGSVAKMEAIVERYEGVVKAEETAKSGIVAQPVKRLFSERIGNFYVDKLATLPILIESMFKGVEKAHYIAKMMGLNDLMYEKTKAQHEANRIVDEYYNKFYDKKANKQDFNTDYNTVERGMIAFLSRASGAADRTIESEFNARAKLISESIKALGKSRDKLERKKASLYSEVYDKLMSEAKNSDDVKNNADKLNVDAVKFWTEKWAEKRDMLERTSESIYNEILDRDFNYTPDRMAWLKGRSRDIEINEDASMFHRNNGKRVYDKKSGVLMDKKVKDELPTKHGEPSMYVDLSFDKNNASSMYDALIDSHTAGPVRRVNGFTGSAYYDKIFPSIADGDMLKERIKLYVDNVRGKNMNGVDHYADLKELAAMSSIGVGMALGGVTQPFKQIIPVAVNTAINSVGHSGLTALYEKGAYDFVNNSGYAVANRGVESQAMITHINKLIDEAARKRGPALFSAINKISDAYLHNFLVKPDVFIAKGSWLRYYEKYMKDHGEKGKIDWENHELNRDAGDYAQAMVDRQQNISDPDLQGRLFSDKSGLTQFAIKAAMPFQNFRMNQTMRMQSDLVTMFSKTASKEDKAIARRSFTGFVTEMASFKAISMGFSALMGRIALSMLGKDDDEKAKELLYHNAFKAQKTGAVTDAFSPFPLFDTPIQDAANFLLTGTKHMWDPNAEDVLFNPSPGDYVKNAGSYGIALSRIKNTWDIGSLLAKGYYIDQDKRKKYINENHKQALEFMLPISIGIDLGVMPSEANTIISNLIKYIKKDAKTEKKDKVAPKEVDVEKIIKSIERKNAKLMHGHSGMKF